MKIRIITNSTDAALIASRYKYSKLFVDIFGEENVKIIQENKFHLVIKDKPDLTVVYGSFRKTYRIPLMHRFKYILCEHDVRSMYRPEENPADEKRKIRNAWKIIFTSPDHQDYIIKKYGYPKDRTMVLYLRPSITDLDFKPLPKKPGKNLVYIGGLLDNNFPIEMSGRFSYRCYGDIFQELINQGWNIHLYPIRKRPELYSKIGCIFQKTKKEGIELYRELSQYTAGIQGFNFVQKSFEYAKTCRPNKIWNYLAAGIPTIGINPGNGIELYENKWGYELKNLKKINDLDFSKLDISKHRKEQIIESQANEFRDFILLK